MLSTVTQAATVAKTRGNVCLTSLSNRMSGSPALPLYPATIIQAEARRDAEILRSERDAGAQSIYNDAYGRDREFFDFWATMKTYRESLTGESTHYIDPPDGDFFRFFGDSEGKGGLGGSGQR